MYADKLKTTSDSLNLQQNCQTDNDLKLFQTSTQIYCYNFTVHSASLYLNSALLAPIDNTS